MAEGDQSVQRGSKQENHRDSEAFINSKDTKKSNKVNDDQRHSDHLSNNVNKGVNNAAVDRFLENVFKAQDDLKWIDQAARGVSQAKSGRKSGIQDFNPSRGDVVYENKLRDKRSFDQNYKTMWMLYRNGYADDLRSPGGPYFEDRSQFNDYDHRWTDDEVHPSNENKFDEPSYQEARDDGPLDDWPAVKDLPFPGDWLTSDMNLEPGSNQKDRLFRDSSNPRENVGEESVARSNSRDERGASKVKLNSKVIKSEEPLTLKSLKQSVLEMRKSLTDDGKKFHGNSKSANNIDSKNKEDNGLSDRRKTDEDKSSEKNENEEHWWNDENMESNDDKTPEQEIQRTKRTGSDKADNEGGSKLFYRAGFGESYPKNNYNRQRRKTNDVSQHPVEITIDESSVNASPDCENSSLISGRNGNIYDEAKGASTYADNIRKDSRDDTSEKTSMKESEDTGKSDLLRKDVDTTGKKSTSMGVEEKVENLQGNSLQTFGSARNELLADSGEAANRDAREESRDTGIGGETKEKAEKTEDAEMVENLGSSRGEQVIKVFEPREHLYQTSGSTKDVERIEPDEKKHGKLSRQISVANNTKEDPGNIKVLLESENKNLIKISDRDNDCHQNSGKSKSMVLDELGVKKNLVLQANGNPCKSVSSVVDIKIHKAHLDLPDPAKKCDDNMPNCRSKKNVNDGYIQRKLLQENRIGTKEVEDEEYSEDEVEDVASNLTDEDEGENEGDDNEEDDDPTELKTAMELPGCHKPKSLKAKVDVMIHKKLNSKTDDNVDYARQKRKPTNIIEYYDYDSEAEEAEHEDDLINDEQERRQNNRDQNSVELKTGLAKDSNQNKPCDEDVGKKVNLHEIAMKKLEKENQKLKNKGPKEEIIDPAQTGDKTPKRKNKSKSISGDEFKDEVDSKIQGEDDASRINRGSNQDESLKPLREEKESNDRGKSSRASEKEIGKSVEYLENLRKKIDSESIENLLEDVQSMEVLGTDQGEGSKNVYSDADDERSENSRKANAVKKLYDELKNVYDWSDNEVKDKPRLKGNQRLHYESDDKEGTKNSAVEPSDFHVNDLQDFNSKTEDKISIENPENKDKYYATNDGEELNKVQANPSADTKEIDPENLASHFIAAPVSIIKNNSKCSNKTNNKAKNNYSELKSTDDLFKGGAEQNSTSEDAAQNLVKVKNDVVLEKDGPKPALEEQKQYINTETRSPYEKSEVPLQEKEHADQEKHVALISEDLHESFVESFDWIDDFDNDVRPRLGRALKTIEETTSMSTINKNEVTLSGTNKCENVTRASFPFELFQPASTMFSISQINDVNDAADIKASSNENQNNIRPKRELMSSYQPFYDDSNQNRRDAERMDYSRYSGGQKVLDDNLRNPNFYENSERVDRRSLDSRWRNEPQDNYDEEEIGDYDDYSKVIRSTDSKKKTRHARKNHLGRPFKKHHKKGRTGSWKQSRSSNPRNRRQRKHLSSSKKRKHRDNRKHAKKRKSNLKKNSEVSNDKNKKRSKIHHKKRGSEGATGGGRVLHENVEDQSTMKSNGETRKKEITALLAADNIEDDSQMDSALHGELAGKIVQQIFEQVQKHNDLKTSLGPGLYRKQKFEDIKNAEENFRQTRNGEEIKQTKESMKKVMGLLNQLVSQEVQSQTCVPLPPDLKEFLDWMLEGDGQNNMPQEGPPIPFLLEGPVQQPQGKYLFQGTSHGAIDIKELQKKLQTMQDLIKEYNSLSEKEKARVQDVRDYLLKQLDLFLKYITANEERTRRKKEETILEYRSAINNDANGSNFPGKNAFPSLINMPALLKPSNPTFDLPGERFRDEDFDLRERRRATRGIKTNSKQQKKPRRIKHRKHKHHKHKRKPKNSKHKASGSRRKRAYLSQDLWDPFDSGFEEPLTYSSLSKVDGISKESGLADELKKSTEDQDKEKSEYWEDVFARHIGSNQEHSIVNLDPAGRPLITGKMKTHILAEHEDIPADYAENKAEINEYRNFPGGRRMRESRAKNVDNKFLLDEDAESNEDNLDDINNNLSNLDYDDEPTSNTIRKREIPQSIQNAESFKNVSNAEKTLDANRNTLSDSPSSSQIVTDLNSENNDKQRNEQTSSLPLITNEQEDLPIKGKDRLEDEVILLNKREAWKRKNEEQLEEVAFGKDMRNKLIEKVIFEKLTEMDKRKSAQETNVAEKRNDVKLPMEDPRNNENCKLLNEDKLKTLEATINVYSDNNRDNLVSRETRKPEGRAINSDERAPEDAKVRGNEKDKQAAINIERELKDFSRSPLRESSNFLSGIQEIKGQHEALDGDNWKMEKAPDLESQLKNLKSAQC